MSENNIPQCKDKEEPSLLSMEKMDRASPDLWPEQMPGVYNFTPLLSPSTSTESVNSEQDETDYALLYHMGSLATLEIIEEVKKLQTVAYQLGVEESKEMTRGKYLHVLNKQSDEK